jgi:hypothetical protein
MTNPDSETLEIVSMRVDPANEPEFLATRSAMIDAMQAAHPGLMTAQLVSLGDGRWMDLVRWRTATEAHAAAADFPNIAEAGAWAALIQEVMSMEHGTIAHEVR